MGCVHKISFLQHDLIPNAHAPLQNGEGIIPTLLPMSDRKEGERFLTGDGLKIFPSHCSSKVYKNWKESIIDCLTRLTQTGRPVAGTLLLMNDRDGQLLSTYTTDYC